MSVNFKMTALAVSLAAPACPALAADFAYQGVSSILAFNPPEEIGDKNNGFMPARHEKAAIFSNSESGAEIPATCPEIDEWKKAPTEAPASTEDMSKAQRDLGCDPAPESSQAPQLAEDDNVSGLMRQALINQILPFKFIGLIPERAITLKIMPGDPAAGNVEKAAPMPGVAFTALSLTSAFYVSSKQAYVTFDCASLSAMEKRALLLTATNEDGLLKDINLAQLGQFQKASTALHCPAPPRI